MICFYLNPKPRVSTRKERSLLHLSKEHVVYLQEYTGEIGLTRDKLDALIACYTNNPCIQLLKAVCINQMPPFKPPPAIKLFFQSIRKEVCPAISITPKELWELISAYLLNVAGALQNLVLLYFY